MADIRIDFYFRINGRGYWRPSKRLRALGFKDVVCGSDGPTAWAVAEGWNRRVDEAERTGIPDPLARRSPDLAEAGRRYPVGSVGEGFVRSPDDFGNIPTRYAPSGPDTETQATGDSGGRAACGVVTAVNG